MRWFVVLLIYRLLLPVMFLVAFPGWILKMLRRGGFGTRMGERAAVFSGDVEFEPCGAIHLHAISVGESLLALKLIRAWSERFPGQRFVLATGTATGHAVATGAAVPGLRVTYLPLDFPSMVRRYLDRFEPSRIVLIEGEAWPHLLIACRRRGIPVSLANARMSPRSERRYRKFAPWVGPLFSMLDAIAIQEPGDAGVWEHLGVDAARIHCIGSIKFDPAGAARPTKRAEFQEILDAFPRKGPVILAASTHAGEDAWVASAILNAVPDCLMLIAPRHAERRAEALADLERAGFAGVLRSSFSASQAMAAADGKPAVLLIDSTGELRDWTAHADVVVIGKTFLAVGGQNPAEAILAGKPVVFGPNMQNFEPLASRLVSSGGGLSAANQDELGQAVRLALVADEAKELTRKASLMLARHQGATRRLIDLLTAKNGAKNG